MKTHNALAKFCKFQENLRDGGDTGKRWMEHRSFDLLRFTLNLLQTGYGSQSRGLE